MNLEDTTYELIDQYLQGALPEAHPFMLRLQQDEELALEVEVRRSLQEAVVDYRLLEVEKILVNKRKGLEESKTTKWKWSGLFWPFFILSVGTVTYFYLAEQKQENVLPTVGTPAKESALPTPPKLLISEPAPSTTSNALSQKAVKEEKRRAAEITPETNFLAPQEANSVTSSDSKSMGTVFKTEQAVEETAPVQNAILVPVDPCKEIRIRAFVEEQRPCFGNTEGQLAIKGTKGGKAPYQYSLDKKPFQEENHFKGLASGEYTLVAKDANGCETIVYENYSLRSKSCASYSEQVFNPNFGPWEVPNHKEKQGTLTVFDLNGQTTYSRTFDIGEKLTWGGTQYSGELLVPGAYIYNINYSDGQMEQGKITITY